MPGPAGGSFCHQSSGLRLNERAEQAIRQWEFKPGERNGKAVKVRISIDVNFRLRDAWFNETAEHRRTSFNIALRELERKDAKGARHARRIIRTLAKEQYAPAMSVQGLWLRENASRPRGDSTKLLVKAKDYGPALYEVGKMHLRGKELALDRGQGLQMIRDAAVLGSGSAQFYLGRIYEKGNGVSADPGRARRYFSLCTAAGEPACQSYLSKLLLNEPDRPECDYLQVVAWLQLASEAGIVRAQASLDREGPNLTGSRTNGSRR